MAAIQHAESLGARRLPAAALHLDLADAQLLEGDKASHVGESLRATYLMERACADAELAEELSREASARIGAQKAAARNEQVQNSLPPAADAAGKPSPFSTQDH